MNLDLEQITYFNLINYQYFLLCIFFVLLVGLLLKYLIGIKLISVVSFALMSIFIGFLYPESSIFSILFGALVLLIIYLSIRYLSIFIKNYVYHYSAVLTLVIISGLFIFVLLLKLYDLIIANVDLVPKYQVFILFCSIVLVPLIDSWLSHQFRNGFKKSLKIFINTLISSIFVGSLISYSKFWDFINQNQLFWVVIVCVVLSSILIGRYSNFRFTEYMRFWPIIYKKKKDV